MSKLQKEYSYADELIDSVMDYIAQKWTPAMIRRQLREYFPDITLKTCNYLIHNAKRRIRERYGIDPEEYKGEQIAFYEYIMRKNYKIADKLKAAERLDKLFGLENVTNIDPAALVNKILEFKRQATNTIGGKDDGGSINVGQGEDDAPKDAGSTTKDSETIDKDVKQELEGNKKIEQTKQSDNTNKVDKVNNTAEMDESISTIEEVNKELGLKDEE